MSKGSRPRPRQVSRAEFDLRYDYAEGKITIEEFYKLLKKIRGKPLQKGSEK
jgi:uncharacterized membrane protein